MLSIWSKDFMLDHEGTKRIPVFRTLVPNCSLVGYLDTFGVRDGSPE